MTGEDIRRSAPYAEDEEIIRHFFERDENALVETQKKYGKLFLSISLGILKSPEDAMECVNDTYLKLWNSIPPDCPRSLRAYGARIAKNLSLNRADYNNAEKRGGGEILTELDESVPDTTADAESFGDLTSLIDSFLRKTDRESRVEFVLRYWYCLPVEEVAHRTGRTVSSTKTRLFKTRQKLRKYLEKEGVSL
ncbi:MAG: sigma-70 family RNA polymerase sigma factor [Clostridia bacterium]|nr:sigma-70 family RNA polymerase sigma factor [Clostridia bacterium]